MRAPLDAAEEMFGVAVEVFAEVTAAGEEGTGGAVGVGAAPGLGGGGRCGCDGIAARMERVGRLGLSLRRGGGGLGGLRGGRSLFGVSWC